MIKLSFLGDLTCDRPFLQAAKCSKKVYRFSGAFQSAKAFLASSDYIVGNLETTFSGSKVPYNKGLHYNTPDSFLQELSSCGVDLLTTANNHCFDGGLKGLTRTLELLQAAGIAHTGTFITEDSPRYYLHTISGIRFAFFSYTYSVNKYADVKIPTTIQKHVNLLRPCPPMALRYRILGRLFPLDIRRRLKIILKKPTISAYSDRIHPHTISQPYLDRIKEEIAEARAKSDIIVFCIHIGGQFNETPGEYSEYMMNFLKENGVDIVIGHHPHTIQKTRISENTQVCAYSLGSFSLSPSAIYIHHECKPEYSQVLHVYIDEDTKIIRRVTFSFLKIVEDDRAFLSVIPVDELYENAQDAEKASLLEDISCLYERITGHSLPQDGILREYPLFSS